MLCSFVLWLNDIFVRGIFSILILFIFIYLLFFFGGGGLVVFLSAETLVIRKQ